MKKHLFRIIAVLSAAVLLAGCASSRLRLGAAAAGGVYNAFGTAMAAQNSTIEVKQTAGSAANLRLLAGGDLQPAVVPVYSAGGYLQLAVAQSDMAQDAYDGSGVFAHESTERSFSAVATLYEEAVQVVVRADSGITTLEELQGCTLSVGEEESGTEQNAGQVLAACGLNNRLVHTVNLNYTDAAARLADGTIDAMFVTAGLPAALSKSYRATRWSNWPRPAPSVCSPSMGVSVRGCWRPTRPTAPALSPPGPTPVRVRTSGPSACRRFCWRRTRCPTRPSKG